MTLDLTALFFWMAFAATAATTLAFGVHWAAEKWLAGREVNAAFYTALGGLAVTVGLVLFRFMPN